MFRPLCLFFLLSLTFCALTSTLTLLQYDPLLFQLSFSYPISLPSFQLLYNNNYDIPYKVITQIEPNTRYLVSADINNLQQTSNLQSYDLLFTNPLIIGDGDLVLNCYMLQANKTATQVSFPSAIVIIVLIGAYFFNMFTEIGKLAIEFTHIYILYIFQNRTTTVLSIYKNLYMAMLLIPPPNILNQDDSVNKEGYILTCMVLPLTVIYILALAGYINLKLGPKKRSILRNIIYEELTFNTFIKSTHLFLFNLLFNSVQFINMLNDSSLQFMENIRSVGIVLVYFNLLTLAFILYLGYYLFNPKIGQSFASWQKYTQTVQFNHFRQLHARLHLTSWYKRNYSLFKMGLMITQILLFFWTPTIFQYMVLFTQFLHIFFIFTVRPFKQQFYLNVQVVCRLALFIQYIVIVLGALYYSMSQITFNYYSAYVFIMVRGVLYLVIMFGLFIGVAFQIYFKCDNLSYQIKLVRDYDQFKLQIVEKSRTESDVRDARSKKSIASQGRSKSQSRRRRQESSEIPTPPKSKKQTVPHKPKSKGRRSKIQIEMVELRETNQGQSSSTSKRDPEGSYGSKRKWRKESLLEGMLETDKKK